MRGFTLIELMLIGAIIALMSTVALASFDVSRAKARDASKIRSVQEIQSSLELYQLDEGQYPQPVDGSGNSVVALNTADKSVQTMSTVLQGLVDSRLLPTIPSPPRGSSIPGDAFYYRTANTGGDTYRCGTRTLSNGGLPYILYFTTERPQKLTPLYVNGNLINTAGYGYCLTLN